MVIDPEKAQSRRWYELLYMGCLSAGIFLLLLWFFRSKLAIITETPIWAGMALIACIFVISIYKGKKTASFFGWRHFLNYPPIWIAALLGGAIAFLLMGYVPGILNSLKLSDTYHPIFQWLGWSAFLAAYASWLVRIVWELQKKDCPDDVPDQKQKLASPSTLFTSFNDLTVWLKDDLPIENERYAIFEHNLVAQRIAARIVWKESPSQALIGQLGSGKTSILNLVKNELKFINGGSRVKIVHAELWPYETPRAAVEGVLGELVESLSQEVDVIGLRGLPESYAEAMSALGGFWSVLVRIQGIPSNPFDILKHVDDIATAIGLTFIVWVEDLERFADGGPEPPNDEKISERLNPIRALLFGLDRMGSVSVVTATTSLNSRFDLFKIARFVEKVPEVKKSDASRILECFRDGCLSKNIIDPAMLEIRKKLEFTADPETFEKFFRMANLDSEVYGPDHALLIISETPRVLKQGLRNCLYIWNQLAGEIDFDDLLIMSMLKVAEPSVFAIIDKYISDLRIKESNEDPRARFKKAMESLVLSEIKREAVYEIIKFVFDEGGKPQGLANAGHADYWKRFLSVPKVEPEESDQRILSVMQGKDDLKVMELIENPACSDAVKDFADVKIDAIKLLSAQRRMELFKLWVERRCNDKEKKWDEEAPGLIPLWQLWLTSSKRGSIKDSNSLPLIKWAYDLAVPKKLALVTGIERFFVISDGDPIFSVEHVKEAKVYLRELLLSTYGGKPERLASALEGTDPRTLIWLCWGIDRLRAKDEEGLPFNDWKLFAQTLMEAVRLQPKIMLPQLACLVVNEYQMPSRKKGLHSEFNAKLTNQLFGNIYDLLTLFQGQDLADWEGDSRVKTLILEAQKIVSRPA
ncbi:MAG: hypothetical protein WCW31_00355 [Patescibacteria group bacterium]